MKLYDLWHSVAWLCGMNWYILSGWSLWKYGSILFSQCCNRIVRYSCKLLALQNYLCPCITARQLLCTLSLCIAMHCPYWSATKELWLSTCLIACCTAVQQHHVGQHLTLLMPSIYKPEFCHYHCICHKSMHNYA